MSPGDYHLRELKVALDPTSGRHILPPPAPPGWKILDLGCGAGQALIAAYPERLSYGLDIDLDALKLGRSLTPCVRFAQGRAEALPYRAGEFDLVTARVSLPYTDIPRSLREIRRVLHSGGQLWMTLHPAALLWRQARAANYRGKIFFAYAVLNSLLLHVAGREFRFCGRYESFQTDGGIRRALRRAGFGQISIARGSHFLVTARAE
jgi:SAM-dependent methyltransferase